MYDNILEQTKKDLDMLVSSSSIQKYAKLFTLILRLRMLCDQGHFCRGLSSPQYSIDMPQAWCATESELGDDVGCDFCRSEESLDLIKDLAFCPSCSRVLQDLNLESSGSMSESLSPITVDSSQSSYSSNKPPGIIQSLTQSQQSFLEADATAKEYPTKLSAVAKNIRNNVLHSKRSVETLVTLGFPLV